MKIRNLGVKWKLKIYNASPPTPPHPHELGFWRFWEKIEISLFFLVCLSRIFFWCVCPPPPLKKRCYVPVVFVHNNEKVVASNTVWGICKISPHPQCWYWRSFQWQREQPGNTRNKHTSCRKDKWLSLKGTTINTPKVCTCS